MDLPAVSSRSPAQLITPLETCRGFVWTVSAGTASVTIQVLVHCSAEWCRNSGPSCKSVERRVSLGYAKFRDDVRQRASALLAA